VDACRTLAVGLTAKSFSDVTGLVTAYTNAYTPYATLDGKVVQVQPMKPRAWN